MCAAKPPKITPQEKEAPKPVVIRNPYLDGDPAMKAQRRGRSQLRIDRNPAAGPIAARMGIVGA